MKLIKLRLKLFFAKLLNFSSFPLSEIDFFVDFVGLIFNETNPLFWKIRQSKC